MDMKRKLHLFSLLFLAAFLLAPVRTMAQVTIGNYTYTFSGDDATITASSLTSGDIVIPTTVSYNGKTYNVTAINYSTVLFNNGYGQKITSIKGESIKSIIGGSNGMHNQSNAIPMLLCNNSEDITSVSFPQLVWLKNCMFLYRANSLTSVYLPSLENIENCFSAFAECTSLTSIDLPKLKQIRGIECLYDLPALVFITIEQPKLIRNIRV